MSVPDWPTAASLSESDDPSVTTPTARTSGLGTPGRRSYTPSVYDAWETSSFTSDLGFASNFGAAAVSDGDLSDFAAGGGDESGDVADLPLPALFPIAGPSTQTGGAPTRTDSQPPVPGASLDVGLAPRGARGRGWPWRYVCDMAAGFEAIQRFRDEGMNTKAAFALAFPGCEFASSTFSDNVKIWNRAREVPGEVEQWRRHGRTEPGLWSAFRKRWRK